jgi:glycosyltransferase involved in cell wall biosynthesis
VGDGDMAATYRRQARDLGLQGRVHFLGRIGPARLPAIYRLADVVVLPSSIQESFGMVLAEAMACGKPVIASRLPGVRTVVADGTTGLLVPPADPAALAGALTRLLGDAPLRAEMGAAGRRRVLARYDWRRIGERLEAVYLGALDATRPVTPPAGRPGGQR